MDWRNVLTTVALVLGALVLVRVAAALLFSLVRVLQTGVVLLLTVLAAGLLVYGGYALVSRVRGGGSPDAGSGDGESTAPEPTDPIERLKQRYTEGELTEAEFERRVARELDDSGTDSIDRGRRRGREREWE